MGATSKLSELVVRQMNEGDLAFAADCTASEGWISENLLALQGFFIRDPAGCLIAEHAGQPVGICIATGYGEHGFIGELIVRSKARGRGIGADLLIHAEDLLKARGVQTIHLDGVLKALGLYERNGFYKVCRSWRFFGHLAGEISPHVRTMKEVDLPQVILLDRTAFGADRSFFLKRRHELYPQLCLVSLEGERITGYIMGCQGKGWVSAGPWVVGVDVAQPIDLLKAFALQAGDTQVSIGILDKNQPARNLVRQFGFTERPDSPWRMASGACHDLGTSPLCYAIGSAAKG
jgi:GNAT superfamily N-acetyltransferase